MNMFAKTKANSIESYLAAVPAERKALIETVHAFIKQTVPSLKPHFAYNMIGYGSFPYTNYKKEPIEWPVIALANQKNYVSIYVCAVINGKYVAETYAAELGKVNVGKSCIRFKKLEDVQLPALAKVLRLAEQSPGLAGVGAH